MTQKGRKQPLKGEVNLVFPFQQKAATMKKFAVLGDGAWGTAIALILAQKPEHQVFLWSARSENARLLREHRENVRLLPGIPIPESIRLTEDIREAVEDAVLWICAIPTVYLRTTFQAMDFSSLPTPTAMLSLTKGIESQTFLRPTQILKELTGARHLSVLSGPSHAEEVSRGQPTSVVVAGNHEALSLQIQQWLTTDRFRVYTSGDLVGVELGGALKNIIGIAAGICDGLSLGDNTKAALLTRGLVEMTRFGIALGAEPHTFSGLAGLGDIITTCMSPHGRNRHVGERLGRGERLEQILQSMEKVAEGVHTTKSAYQRASTMAVDMPITEQVYQVLYEEKQPLEAVHELMVREPRGERPY